jgi:hypothetical protein
MMDELLRMYRAGLITDEELARRCIKLGYNGGVKDGASDPTGWNR